MSGNFVQTLVVLVSCILLNACATIPEVGLVHQSQVDQLSTGISQESINNLFEGNLPKQVIHHQHDADDYQVSIYDLVIGSELVLDFNCEVIRLCLPVEVDVPITTEYVLIQKLPELTLVDWGTVEHLNQSKDKKTQALLIEVNAYIDAQKAVN